MPTVQVNQTMRSAVASPCRASRACPLDVWLKSQRDLAKPDKQIKAMPTPIRIWC